MCIFIYTQTHTYSHMCIPYNLPYYVKKVKVYILFCNLISPVNTLSSHIITYFSIT